MSVVGSTIGHFRIEGVLGKGGMGEVYVAFDETLERKVALKAIRTDRRLSTDARRRFLREARLLSRLDHPHICRIHDYVEQDGHDYLVLELIDGVSLREAIQTGLDPSTKLKVAEQIAGVLEAAHAEGIVHRDLKTANVMLTESGDAKVLDFGLARTTDSDPARDEMDWAVRKVDFDAEMTTTLPGLQDTMEGGTALGSVLGTPSYMSPEQARGEPVTPASDMYSFGLLLQVLFTGRRPFERASDPAMLLDLARKGETVPVTGMSADLTSLIQQLKSPAAAVRPTAIEAAERLRRIRDKPRRRMRNLAIAVGIAIVVLAGVKYTVDLRRERAAALEARAEAERRRDQAEDLIGFMLGDLRDKLTPVGRLDVLDDVGDKALEYFASLSEAELTDDELFRRSKTLSQIGEVRMAQGNLLAATEAFDESIALATDLYRRDPQNGEWLMGLGAGYFWAGSVLFSQGDLDGAGSRFRQYRDVSEQLVAMNPENPQWQMELAYSHGNLGALHEARGEIDAALESIGKSVEIKQRLVDSDPSNADWRRSLANGESWMGSTLEASGDLRGALESFESTLAIWLALLDEDPENTETMRLLSVAHSFIGGIHIKMGSVAKAVEHLEIDRRIATRLVDRDPSNLDWQRELVVSHMQLGLALMHSEPAAGGAELSAARGIAEELVKHDPTNADWQLLLVPVRLGLGAAALANGDARSALDHGSETMELLQPWGERSAEDPQIPRRYAESLNLIGQARAALGDSPAARRAWDRALGLLAPVAAASNNCDLHATWARSLMLLDRLEEAREIVERLAASGYSHPDFVALCEKKGIALGAGVR